MFVAISITTLPAFAQNSGASRPDEQRSKPPAEARSQSQPPKPGEAPTDAERIARLQRSIDDANAQLEELNGKLNAPDSEFKQAESAFSALDRRLTDLRKAVESADESVASSRPANAKELDELTPKHKLARERFDLAIAERKTLQQQIATIRTKLQQDGEALQKLKGDKPAASQPAAAAPGDSSATPAQAGAPAAPPSTGRPAPAPGESQAAATAPPAEPAAAAPGATAPAADATTAAGESPPAADQKSDKQKPAPEVVAARREASRKQAAAASAQAEVASITERMEALHKNIELERQLLETSRKKADNAQETERSLYESYQKKLEEGAPAAETASVRKQMGEARERLRDAQNEIREHSDRLDEFQGELSDLQSEHIGALSEARKREDEASQAQKRVENLESPLSPRNLLRWLTERGPRVAGIILATIILLRVARMTEGRIARLMTGRAHPDLAENYENRARTLVSVFHSAATVAIYGGGGLMILTEIGVNIVPLMGGAAVFGLAVAFGAQNLIRDYFYGFMILLENQYTVNDVVKISDVSGQVERITLRCTVLRGLDGTVHFIPNGEITRVSNMTHEWSRALFDIPVAYKEDVDRVMEELVELAKELRRDPEFRGLIMEMPEMLGVDEFADSAVVIKFLIKTRPLKQWLVKRELLRRIKKRFDELGIEIPFPHRTVYHRHENGGDLARLAEGSPHEREVHR